MATVGKEKRLSPKLLKRARPLDEGTKAQSNVPWPINPYKGSSTLPEQICRQDPRPLLFAERSALAGVSTHQRGARLLLTDPVRRPRVRGPAPLATVGKEKRLSPKILKRA